MNVVLKKLPKSIIELEITVPYQEVSSDVAKAAAELAGTHAIQGFRPGKAPLEAVQRTLGAAKVLETAVQYFVPRTLLEALESQKIVETVGRPEILLKTVVPGNDIVYTAKVTILPSVAIKSLDGIRVPQKEIAVDPKKVDALVADLQKMRAKEIAVTRSAQQGDKVLLDMTVSLAGVPVEGGSQAGMMLWLGHDSMVPGFVEKIIGATIGQGLKFELPFPATYHVKHLAGKQGEFSVSIKNIFEVELPALDDVFARGMGNFTDMRELRRRLEDNLKEESDAEESKRVERELIKKMIGVSTFDELPEILIEQEIHRMEHELRDGIAQRGIDFDQWLSNIDKKKEDLKKEWEPRAEERVKAALIMRQLAREQSLEAAEDEIEKELNAVLARYAGEKEIVKQIKNPEYRSIVRHELENRKVMLWLKEKYVTQKT